MAAAYPFLMAAASLKRAKWKSASPNVMSIMREPFEIVADDDLIDDTHRAVQLHGLLSDEAGGLTDVGLGARYRAAARRRIADRSWIAAMIVHRAGLFRGNEHVRHAVLQHLKTADRSAELLAALQVTQRRLVERGDDAERLGAERRHAEIDRALDDRERRPGMADQGVCFDADALELQVRGAAARLGRIGKQFESGRVALHEEQGNAVGIGELAAAARRHEKIIGRRGVEHDGLAAREAPAVAVAIGAAGDVRES
jgi:hypothetical protein